MIPATRNNENTENLYERFVNPQWVRLLDVLQMNVSYTRCSGAELHTADGQVILDFNSGYCVHNVGHNHPRIVAALKDELDKSGPAMLQSHVADLAGELAGRLCKLAGGRLSKVFFGSSGSEGVEAAIKFARAHTAALRRFVRIGRISRSHMRGAFVDVECLLERGLRIAAA